MMACAFISVERLCIIEEVTAISVPDKVDWAKSIILDNATVIDVWLI